MTIFCKTTSKGVQSFYLHSGKEEYFLFSQNYRKGVNDYFRKGVGLEKAVSFASSHGDRALMNTMTKIPRFLRYVEQEQGIVLLEKTRKKQKKRHACGTSSMKEAC